MPEILTSTNLDGLTIVQENQAVVSVDVRSILPDRWGAPVRKVIESSGKDVSFRGGFSTSRADESFITAYRIVDGEKIACSLPWLIELYRGPFRAIVSKIVGEVEPDNNKKYGVNINTLSVDTQIGDGHVFAYEPHVDRNHITGMLAASTVNEGDGGELVLAYPDDWRPPMVTRIKTGRLYVFAGDIHEHAVARLNPEGRVRTRITIPMDYVYKGSVVERPEDMKVIFGNGNGKH